MEGHRVCISQKHTSKERHLYDVGYDLARRTIVPFDDVVLRKGAYGISGNKTCTKSNGPRREYPTLNTRKSNIPIRGPNLDKCARKLASMLKHESSLNLPHIIAQTLGQVYHMATDLISFMVS